MSGLFAFFFFFSLQRLSCLFRFFSPLSSFNNLLSVSLHPCRIKKSVAFFGFFLLSLPSIICSLSPYILVEFVYRLSVITRGGITEKVQLSFELCDKDRDGLALSFFLFLSLLYRVPQVCFKEGHHRSH